MTWVVRKNNVAVSVASFLFFKDSCSSPTQKPLSAHQLQRIRGTFGKWSLNLSKHHCLLSANKSFSQCLLLIFCQVGLLCCFNYTTSESSSSSIQVSCWDYILYSESTQLHIPHGANLNHFLGVTKSIYGCFPHGAIYCTASTFTKSKLNIWPILDLVLSCI